MPSLGLGLGLQRPVGSLLDSDVQAFKSESGATSLTGLNNLVKYLKGESKYDNFVIYPMKSAQNAGSGSTVYSLGGLTTNNMSLVSLPSWSASGVTFDGVADYGRISNFLSGGITQTVFHRTAASINNTGIGTLISDWDSGTNERSFYLIKRGDLANDPYEIIRAPNGTSTGANGTSYFPQISTDVCHVLNFKSTFSYYLNKVEVATNSTTTSLFNSSSDITVSALLNSNSAGFFGEQTVKASAFCNATLTATQRETITDLINAL